MFLPGEVQIPNNLALRLDAQKVPILGTSAKSIDNAEDREKFSAMLDRIGVDQPRWRELTSMDDINEFVEEVGFPVLCVRHTCFAVFEDERFSSNQEELEHFCQLAANVSKKHPVVVSQLSSNMPKEVEMGCGGTKWRNCGGLRCSLNILSLPESALGRCYIQFPPGRKRVETVAPRIKRISRILHAN